MKMISKALVAASLALAAGASFAGHDLGGGTGTFGITGDHDSSWYVTLGPGTYTFTSAISGGVADDIWLSTSGDATPHETNDYTDFTSNVGGTAWNLSSYTLTLTQATQVFVNIDMHKKVAAFDGSLTVSAVPEPATGALLLAGLGLMGFVARRRRG
jgi:hypothetical protein